MRYFARLYAALMPHSKEFRAAAARSKALCDQRLWLIEHQRRQNIRHALTLARQMRSAGFTLIELLIAVAIVGILAVLAIGTYQSYTVRAAASEAVTMLDANKNAVASDYETTGTFPGNATEAGVDVDNIGKYVSSVRVGGAGGERQQRQN